MVSRRALAWISLAVLLPCMYAHILEIRPRRQLLDRIEAAVGRLAALPMPAPGAPLPPDVEEARRLIAAVGDRPGARIGHATARLAKLVRQWGRRRLAADLYVTAARLTPGVTLADVFEERTPVELLGKAIDCLRDIGQVGEALALVHEFAPSLKQQLGAYGAWMVDDALRELCYNCDQLDEHRRVSDALERARITPLFINPSSFVAMRIIVDVETGETARARRTLEKELAGVKPGAGSDLRWQARLGLMMLDTGDVTAARALRAEVSAITATFGEDATPPVVDWHTFQARLHRLGGQRDAARALIAKLPHALSADGAANEEPRVLAGRSLWRIIDVAEWSGAGAGIAACLDRMRDHVAKIDGRCGLWAALTLVRARAEAHRDPARALRMVEDAQGIIERPEVGEPTLILWAALVRARALTALGRRDEARRVLADADRVGRPDIPDRAPMRRELASVSP